MNSASRARPWPIPPKRLLGQAPNVGSAVTRINAGDDAPAEVDAVVTTAAHIAELLESEDLRREAVTGRRTTVRGKRWPT